MRHKPVLFVNIRNLEFPAKRCVWCGHENTLVLLRRPDRPRAVCAAAAAAGGSSESREKLTSRSLHGGGKLRLTQRLSHNLARVLLCGGQTKDVFSDSEEGEEDGLMLLTLSFPSMCGLVSDWMHADAFHHVNIKHMYG